MAGEYIEFNNNSQPALNDVNINRLQQLIKQDIQGAVSGDTLPIGVIMPFGSDTIPKNWLLCNGQAVSRTDYQELFNTLGTTYGSGDGFTTFNLPDLQGKIPVGKDENDTDFDTLGETGGEKEHTLTINEIPPHTHKTWIKDDNLSETEDGYDNYFYGKGRFYNNTSQAGGGRAHNNLQPYVVSNFIIKAKQSAGIIATVVDSLESESETDALSARQGKKLKEKVDGTALYSTTSTKVVEKITLEDDVNNYDYIDITVTRAGQQTTHTSRIYKKDYDKKNSLLSVSTGSYLTIFALTIALKNTEISIVSGDSISFSNHIEGFANGIESIITDVIGYK